MYKPFALIDLGPVHTSHYCCVKFTSIKVVWYPKMDQKVCLNMVKKDQLCGIALKKRN